MTPIVRTHTLVSWLVFFSFGPVPFFSPFSSCVSLSRPLFSRFFSFSSFFPFLSFPSPFPFLSFLLFLPICLLSPFSSYFSCFSLFCPFLTFYPFLPVASFVSFSSLFKPSPSVHPADYPPTAYDYDPQSRPRTLDTSPAPSASHTRRSQTTYHLVSQHRSARKGKRKTHRVPIPTGIPVPGMRRYPPTAADHCPLDRRKFLRRHCLVPWPLE